MRNNSIREISFIRKLHTLVSVNLDFNSISYISMVDVRELNNLQKLSLRSNNLMSASFLLLTLPSLTHINLAGNL